MSRKNNLLIFLILTSMHLCVVMGVMATPLETAVEYAEEGDRYQQEGQFFQAVNAYRKALANGLEHRDLHRNLAITLSDLWLFDDAIKELEKALELAPDDILLRVELGILYLVKNKFDLAEQELTAALSVDPTYTDAYYYLGEVFFQTGQYRLAWYAMETARKLGHPGRMLLEKLQEQGTLPERYPWAEETSLIAFRQVVVATQKDAESFLHRYQQGELFADIVVGDLDDRASNTDFVGIFTPADLQEQIVEVLSHQKPYAEPIIVETDFGYQVVQRVLPFDLAGWKRLIHEKKAVRLPEEQTVSRENMEEASLCVGDQNIDLQKRRVYVGAYITQKDAVSAVNKLRAEGFPAFCLETKGKDERSIYNAVAGQFISFDEAKSVLLNLQEKGYTQGFISRSRKR